jgi:hypothetical protein
LLGYTKHGTGEKKHTVCQLGNLKGTDQLVALDTDGIIMLLIILPKLVMMA